MAVQSVKRIRVLLLLEQGGWTIPELAAAIDSSHAGALHHVRELVAAGVVREIASEAVSGGRRRTYATTRDGWADAIEQLNKLAGSEPAA